MPPLDAVVIGSGPNGLAAAVVLARSGLAVKVIEARDAPGGGARSAESTLPGYVHDVCSAIHPMAALSPIFRALGVTDHGVTWAVPPAALAHPLDDGSVAMLEASLETTAAGLGADAGAYRDLLEPFVRSSGELFDQILAPPLAVPAHPLLLARFGMLAMQSATWLGRARFEGAHARALFAGCAAHSVLPLDEAFSAAFGIVLAVAGHVTGWPCAKGGSQTIADALAALLRARGGEIETGRDVRTMADLPDARAYLFDTAPRHLADIARDALPPSYRERLRRYRYGPGIFKVDWALAAPIPWRAPEVLRAGTVHLGGTMEEVAAAEAAPWRGQHAERPFVLLAQQSLFDTRAPPGRHTGWAYCHVPAGSTFDMTSRIEAQVERFAPGFRDTILAKKTTNAPALEAYNANAVGGDITGGVNDARQIFARPVARTDPYRTPNPRIFLCSSSTPPGGGVHGMCGYHAARSALRRVFGIHVDLATLGEEMTGRREDGKR